jgi:hypothetical protein
LKDSTPMLDMLKARQFYKEVVNEINTINTRIIFE